MTDEGAPIQPEDQAKDADPGAPPPRTDEEAPKEADVTDTVEGKDAGPGAKSDRPRWSPAAWGEASRALALTFLLGMALTVTIRFSTGDEWLVDFLRKNQFPMGDRMAFLAQTCVVGGLLSLACLGFVLFRRDGGKSAATWEGWAWFLSPAILLPSIPVVMAHKVWAQKHEELLPVVLFGILIAEVLFTKAFRNVPALVTDLVRRFREWDEPDPRRTANRWGAFLKKHSALLVVVALALAYGAFMSFYTVRWHHKLGTATFDLGINNNLLYGGLEGRFNQSPVIFPDDPQKYVANHLKIGLYAFLPIYALYPKAETLLVIQSVSLGLGAIPLFLFLRRRLPQWWAVAIAASYLAYYPMHGANFYEMKLVPTSAAIVLLCIYAIDAKRWVLGGIMFVLATVMREDMPVPMAVVGAVFLLSGHRPRAGLLMAGTATIWFILIRFRVMNEVGSWWFPNMYEDLWAAPEKGFRSVIKTLVSNPTFTLKHIFVEKKFWYLMHLLVPLAFLPVRRWYTWAALIPGAIMTLLVTDYGPPTMFSFQYVMHWAPYLFVAAGLVLASIAKSDQGPERAKGALLAMCLSSAALSFNYGAFTLRDRALESGYHKITFDFSEEEKETYEDVKRLVASIPQSATVGSTERVGAHLSSRVGFYTLRRGSHGVEYMVARKSGLRLDRTKETIRDGLTSGEYGVVGRYGEFLVFKRGASTDGNAAVIDEWDLTGKRKTKRTNRPKKSKRDDKSPSSTAAGKLDDDDDSDEDDDNDDSDDVKSPGSD